LQFRRILFRQRRCKKLAAQTAQLSRYRFLFVVTDLWEVCMAIISKKRSVNAFKSPKTARFAFLNPKAYVVE
jgi:hypothetical protein